MTDLQSRLNKLYAQRDNFDVSEYIDEDSFQEQLDDELPLVEVVGYQFGTYEALRKLDPIAFRQEYLAWCDAVDLDCLEEYNEIIDEIEELESVGL